MMLIVALLEAGLNPIIWISGVLIGFFVLRHHWLIVAALFAGLSVAALAVTLHDPTAYRAGDMPPERLLVTFAGYPFLTLGIAYVFWGLRRLARR